MWRSQELKSYKSPFGYQISIIQLRTTWNALNDHWLKTTAVQYSIMSTIGPPRGHGTAVLLKDSNYFQI